MPLFASAALDHPRPLHLAIKGQPQQRPRSRSGTPATLGFDSEEFRQQLQNSVSNGGGQRPHHRPSSRSTILQSASCTSLSSLPEAEHAGAVSGNAITVNTAIAQSSAASAAQWAASPSPQPSSGRLTPRGHQRASTSQTASPNTPIRSLMTQTHHTPLFASTSSGTATSSYVNANDECLRIVETNVKLLKNLIQTRQQQVQQEALQAQTSGGGGGGVRERSSSSGAASISELSDMINYLVWFTTTSLSKLLINPEPFHLSSLCAHPAVTSYAPFNDTGCSSGSANHDGSGNSHHGFSNYSSHSPSSFKLSSMTMGLNDLNAASTTTTPILGTRSLNDDLTLKASSSMSSLSTETSSSASSSESSPNNSPVLLGKTISGEEFNGAAMTIGDSINQSAIGANNAPLTFSPPHVLSHSTSAALFATHTGPASHRPILTLAPLDLNEMESQIKRECECDDRKQEFKAPSTPRSLPPSPSSANSRRRSIQISSVDTVKSHFRQILGSSSHPYGYALSNFLHFMRDENGKKMRRWLGQEQEKRRSQSTSSMIVTLTASEEQSLCESYLHHQITLIRSFLSWQYRLMLATYPSLASAPRCRKLVHHVLQSLLFDSLSKTLLLLYSDNYQQQNQLLYQKIFLLATRTHVNDVTEWKHSRERNSKTIQLLKSFISHPTIREKFSFAVLACTNAKAVDSSSSMGEEVDDSVFSTDDLIATLTSCLLHLTLSGSDADPSDGGSVSQLYSQLRLLNDCFDESMIANEIGFCMTTLTVACHAIAHADESDKFI